MAELTAVLKDRYHAALVDECNMVEVKHNTGAECLKAINAFYRQALNDGKTLSDEAI